MNIVYNYDYETCLKNWEAFKQHKEQEILRERIKMREKDRIEKMNQKANKNTEKFCGFQNGIC